MPLRDHFHEPLPRNRWDKLHGQWPAMIVLQLQAVLPKQYSAAPQVHLASAIEVDIGTFEREDNDKREDWSSNGGGGTATALWTVAEPTLQVETEMPDVDEYEVQIFDGNDRLVAAIELVSPGNKDRPANRSAFITKCAALLQEKVSVIIVDIVTERASNLYAELLEFMEVTDPTVTQPPSPIYAVACRGRRRKKNWLFEAWQRPLQVGQSLPQLPIWLAENLAITLDLETSYEDTCKALRMM